jgi:hypothetical protein
MDCSLKFVKVNVSRNRQFETSCEEVVIRDQAGQRTRNSVAK